MMKKTLLVLLGGIALASAVATVEAKGKHCRRDKCERIEKVCPKRECPIECPKECDPCTTPAQEICGVLCKAVEGFEYKPVPDRCCEKSYPCAPKRCVRLIPQPDKVEKKMCKREICIPQPDIVKEKWIKEEYCEKQPDRIEYEWYEEEYCVPQPPVEEVYYEEQPNKCCKEMVPCPPVCVPCIRYIPVDINIEHECVPAVNACEYTGSTTPPVIEDDPSR